MNYCRMEIYSHFVKICDIKDPVRPALRKICEELTQYKWEKENGRFFKSKFKVFGASPFDRSEYRFNINMLPFITELFKQHGISNYGVDIINHEMYEPAPANIKMPTTWQARDEQVPLIEYLVAPGRLKTLSLRTGGGKTSCSLKAAELIGQRLMVVVLGRYFDKWIGDVQDAYKLPADRVLTIRGCNQLITTLQYAYYTDIDADVVIVSSKTIQEYITRYEQTLFAGMPEFMVPPEQIYRILKVGTRIIDEAHQHFHLNFKIDCYTHMPKGIYLSATLKPDDAFLNRMYEIAYPINTRIGGGVDKKYVNSTSVRYGIKDWKKVRCTRKGQYSHVMLEQWLIKRKDSLQHYLEMIHTVVKKEYIDKRKDSQKMLIFAATVEMCEIIRDYLKGRAPQLKIEKYNSEDDYETIHTSDITVSTLGSAGTAVDIKDLITCLMTTALSARQANEQAIGRLRELKQYPDQVPHFLFLTCRDIPKHMSYEENKVKMLAPRVLRYSVVEYGSQI